ncbi:MAG: DUF86 domain-containing protein [Bacteroidota bacterium]
MLEAIKEIESYTNAAGLPEFLANSMMRFASVKQIEIIGEAANYISSATKDKFSDIEWSQITGMRHILVHEYFGIDANLVWQVIIKDLPKLKEKVNLILLEV